LDVGKTHLTELGYDCTWMLCFITSPGEMIFAALEL